MKSRSDKLYSLLSEIRDELTDIADLIVEQMVDEHFDRLKTDAPTETQWTASKVLDMAHLATIQYLRLFKEVRCTEKDQTKAFKSGYLAGYVARASDVEGEQIQRHLEKVGAKWISKKEDA